MFLLWLSFVRLCKTQTPLLRTHNGHYNKLGIHSKHIFILIVFNYLTGQKRLDKDASVVVPYYQQQLPPFHYPGDQCSTLRSFVGLVNNDDVIVITYNAKKFKYQTHKA